MGMPISLHVRAWDADRIDIAHGAAQVFAHLRKVDAVFSLYRTDSELARLRRGELSVGCAHPWVEEVDELCQQATVLTEGLFTSQLPTSPAGAPVHSGGSSPGTVFDPTGLVKGWAASGAAAYLQELPDVSYCLNAAGDIVIGTGRGVEAVQPWRVGIEDPAQRGRIARTVKVTTGSVATSGSATRGDHFYDPLRGTWTKTKGSATVVGPDLLWSDVWATAAVIDPARVAALLPQRDPTYGLILV